MNSFIFLTQIFLKTHNEEFPRNCFGYDCFRDRDSTVHPSITHFDVGGGTDDNLKTIVSKFPNLISLGFANVELGTDLCILKNLRKLSRIEFGYNYCIDSSVWNNFEQLLLRIGHNIRVLRFEDTFPEQYRLTQNAMEFIFKSCPHIEKFSFHHEPRHEGDNLIVLSFKKLMVLECHRSDAVWNCGDVVLSGLPRLRNLTVKNFCLTAETLESFIVDNSKFPNLETLRIDQYFPEDIKSHLERLAVNNNLRMVIRLK